MNVMMTATMILMVMTNVNVTMMMTATMMKKNDGDDSAEIDSDI